METAKPGIEATIHEMGNGLPGPSDVASGLFIAGGDTLYRVLELTGPIHTGEPGAGNYIHARVIEADWEDCEEGDEYPARVRVLD